MTGYFVFSKESIVRVGVYGILRWANVTAGALEGSFFVPEGNLRYLINYGLVERIANTAGPGILPGLVRLEFPLLNAGTGSRLAVLWGDLQIAPRRPDARSLESDGQVSVAVGTTLTMLSNARLADGVFELTPRHSHASPSVMSAKVVGQVEMAGGLLDLSMYPAEGFTMAVDYLSIANTTLKTRVTYGDALVNRNALNTYSMDIGENCNLVVVTDGDLSPFLGLDLYFMGARVANGGIRGDFASTDMWWRDSSGYPVGTYSLAKERFGSEGGEIEAMKLQVCLFIKGD